MKLKLYRVDAFTDKLFSGNPTAVCPLDKWLSDDLMRTIAAENCLSATAFYIKEGDNFHIRWFTPTLELDLNGNATLATAHVLVNHLGYSGTEINFNSRSGMLKVKKQDDKFTINFPADEYERVKNPAELSIALSARPMECYRGKADYMLVYGSEQEIINLKPNFRTMAMVDSRGIIVTAPGSQTDFVSRFFAPHSGINEDYVTGSAHATLVPYWAQKLGKVNMSAMQLSSRKGYLNCTFIGERVELSGKAVTYLVGEIETD
jgi:PhzF family phenazine biosynthesis protein